MLQHPLIGPLRRFWRLETQFIFRAQRLWPTCGTHKRTALRVIYLENRRSTTELRPQALLDIDNRTCARLPRTKRTSSHTAHEELITAATGLASGGGLLLHCVIQL